MVVRHGDPSLQPTPRSREASPRPPERQTGRARWTWLTPLLSAGLCRCCCRRQPSRSLLSPAACPLLATAGTAAPGSAPPLASALSRRPEHRERLHHSLARSHSLTHRPCVRAPLSFSPLFFAPPPRPLTTLKATLPPPSCSRNCSLPLSTHPFLAFLSHADDRPR